MNIVIKPLTPELADDYFDFFENRAFTDDSPYRCYCQVFQMSRDDYQATYAETLENPGPASRREAERQITGGVLRGYLAYLGGKSIGWCNAKDRADYPAIPQNDVPFHSPVANEEMGVICFMIAPECRGKGVATALLNRVIDDARAEGYHSVVSFPVHWEERFKWDCRGPLRMYEKAGFVKEADVAPGENYIMKMALK